MHSHNPFGLGSAVAFALLHASLAWAGDAPTLPPDHAVALALTVNPEVRLAEAALLMAEAERSASLLFLNNPQAQTWSSFDGSRGGLSVSQPLSLTGEGRFAHAAARASVSSAEATLDRTRRERAAQVRLVYIDVVVATEQARVALEGTEIAGRLRYAVTRKRQEGEASPLDLRLARLAEAQAVTRLLQARAGEAEALRDLAAMVGIPVEADHLVSDPAVAVPAQTVSSQRAERSDVVAAEHALQAARAQLSRQRAGAIPAVSVGVGVEVEGGSTVFVPSLGVTVPLFDRNQRGTGAAVGNLAVAESRLVAVQARAETEAQTGQRRADEAQRFAEVVGTDTLDEATAALASVEAGVLAGEIDLTTAALLQAQILDGEVAIVILRGLVAAARIDVLLSLDDDALLGGGR